MTEFRTIDGERERQRVAGRRHLKCLVAHCSDPAVCSPIPWLRPLLQSICTFFLFNDQSWWTPSTPPSRSFWFLSDVLTSAFLLAPPPTAASHRHKYIFLFCSLALLSCLCFCWSASASACAWFSAVNLHATWNKPTRENGKRITSTCAPELEAKSYVSVYVCAAPF